MYLSHARIRNFRSINDLEVEFQPGLTVILGENNIGKTTVIDAIRFALGAASTGYRVGPRSADLRRGYDEPTFSVDLRFSGVGEAEMADFIECLVYDTEHPERSHVEIHYQWSWNEDSQKYSERRWGGSGDAETPIPSEVLQSLPFIYLEPLRDALSFLTAGRSSRVGYLMRRLRKSDEGAGARIESILSAANERLSEDDLVKRVIQQIQDNLNAITGELSQSVDLVASVHRFESIVNGLSVALRHLVPNTAEDEPALYVTGDLAENGLGYNNVLYVATVLAELINHADGDRPILCVEEPEAHLHPQLQILLGEYFRRQAERPEGSLQVMLTTHSPTLAAHLPIESLCVLHHPYDRPAEVAAASLWKCELTVIERKKLARLIDTTKASLFFAKKVLLVEGVCEHLILSGMSSHLAGGLDSKGITVIPLHGLSFETMFKLFSPSGIRILCAAIRDGDPGQEVRKSPLVAGLGDADHWRTWPCIQSQVLEERAGGGANPAPNIRTFLNKVTLEYDLALAGDNAAFITRTWRASMGRAVPALTEANVASLQGAEDRAVFIYQSICCAGVSYKARFAQELALSLADAEPGTVHVPPYVGNALAYLGYKSNAGVEIVA